MFWGHCTLAPHKKCHSISAAREAVMQSTV